MRSLRNVRSTGMQRLLLGAGYGASLLTTAFVIWLIVSARGTAPIGQASQYLLIMVSLNLILLLGLIWFVIRRVVAIARSRGADAGARLHLRFVFLFSMAAVLPAIIVALAFMFLNRGLDTWFSDRVRGSVENGYAIGGIASKDISEGVVDSMNYIYAALGSSEAKALFQNRLAFSVPLKKTLDTQPQLNAVYIIDKSGQILARAEQPNAFPYFAPPQSAIDEVRSTNLYIKIDDSQAVRVLYKLPGYNDPDGAFLYGIRPLASGLVNLMTGARAAINAYSESARKKSQVQGVFFMAYLEAVLLLLIGAIWGGTSAAESIALPVARLVQAADKVAAGDLNVRVM
ncbi:MAG: PAS domain-containing sensor histidine kinase, partial [Asticcacaulis sp.]|nr:PAS domain-containing sensor histidine kinase [Asticcacaulis sp.]